MSIQARKEKEKEALRQKILAAARELFVDEGYENVSMRKVARKIEYSPTTIYLYFKNKAELLDSICDETHANLLNTLETLFQDRSDPVETLRKCARAYTEFGLKHPEDYKLTIILRPQYQKGLGLAEGSHATKMFNFLHAVVRECVQRKKFRQVDIVTTSQAVWSAVHGVTSLLIAYPDFPWVDRDKLITQVIDTTIEGLKA